MEIAYDVSLPPDADVDSVLKRVKEHAERKGFKAHSGSATAPGVRYLDDMHVQARFEIIQRGTATDCLESHEGEWPSEVKSAYAVVHPNASPMEITLGRYPSGWFGFGGVKTHHATPQVHKDIVEILELVGGLGATLRVYDDSTYYETRDESRLIAIRDLTNSILALRMSIMRAAAMAIDARVGRQTLTYEAELRMTEYRWMMNEGKVSQFVCVGASAPWEEKVENEESFLRALKSNGIGWVFLPDAKVPDDLFARIFDLDPKHHALNDLLFHCLDVNENGASLTGRIFPCLVTEAKGVRDRKVIPPTGRSDSDVVALEKLVSESGSEVERYAFSYDAYLTMEGKRHDTIFVQGGERSFLFGTGIAQRYAMMSSPPGFHTIGQPIVIGPTNNSLHRGPTRLESNPPFVLREEPTISAVEGPPTITVDEEHSHMFRENDADPPPYVIARANSLILDLDSYFFEQSKVIGKTPNSVNVIVGKSSYFGGFDPSHKKIELKADNLKRVRGGVFRGFDDHGLVTVGWLDWEQAARGAFHIIPFWMAMFHIEGLEVPPIPVAQEKPEGGGPMAEFEVIADAPEVSQTDMRKINVYFSRGTRDQNIPKKIYEAAREQMAGKGQGGEPGSPSKAQEVGVKLTDDTFDVKLEEGQVPFVQVEGLAWLTNNKNKAAFASERFHTTKDAIDAVKRLYEAGAVKVEVVATYNEPSRIEREGGPYADELEVTFPAEGKENLLAVIKGLEPDNWRMGGLKLDRASVNDVGPEPETLWWAGV